MLGLNWSKIKKKCRVSVSILPLLSQKAHYRIVYNIYCTLFDEWFIEYRSKGRIQFLLNILKKDRTTKLNCILYSPKKVRLLEIYYLQFLNKKESKNIVRPIILLICIHYLSLCNVQEMLQQLLTVYGFTYDTQNNSPDFSLGREREKYKHGISKWISR